MDTLILILDFISLFFGLAFVIIALDCIWRTKGHLKAAMIFAVFAAAVFCLTKVMGLFGFQGDLKYNIAAKFMDFLMILFALFSSLHIYKLVRQVDKEEGPEIPNKMG